MATIVQAVRMALHVGETQLGVTDVFGEDVHGLELATVRGVEHLGNAQAVIVRRLDTPDAPVIGAGQK